MLAALLIMVREGFEAALIVAILAVYLRRIDRLELRRNMWLGVGSALVLAAVLGVVLDRTIGGLEGRARLRAFAAISLFAVAVLTWMIFWMRKNARNISGELRHKLDEAVAAGNVRTAVFVVAFVAVLREMLEAALFLVATTTTDSGGRVVLGAAIGVAIAVALGVAVNVFGHALPMKAFFAVTGMIIVVFAAGLLSRAVLYLQSSGDLGTLNNAVYNLTMYPWLTQSTEVGKFLAALLGWDPRPSIEQVVAWLAFFVPVTYLFLRPAAKQKPAAARVEEEKAPA